MAGATERLAHVVELIPDICTIDCGTMNFAEGDYVMTNTPSMLREMARQVQELGVRPEIEVFDTGHLVFAKRLIEEGLIDEARAAPALHGHSRRRPPPIRARCSRSSTQLARRLRLLRVRDRTPAAPLRRARAARRRQRPRRARGQHLARAWRQGDERGARRASGDDPRGDERPRARGRRRPARSCASRSRPWKAAIVGGRRDRRRLGRRLVENGVDVNVYDPHPEAERRLQGVLDNAERAWAQLTMAPRARGVATSCPRSRRRCTTPM